MNIVLTGFMGTGKSAVGRELAARLGWQFFDTDEIIEKDTHVRIADIFEKKGEPFFRAVETKAVALVSLLDRAVIACGGGVVLKKENMDALEKNGVIVCLAASPEKILELTGKSAGRPLLKVADPLAKIRELLSARAPYYARCRFSVPIDDKTVAQVAQAILEHPALVPALSGDRPS